MMSKMANGSLIKFSLVGVLNTGIGLTLFPIIYFFIGDNVSFNYQFTGSFLVCLLISFFTNQRISFNVTDYPARRLLLFVGFHGAHYSINLFCLNLIYLAGSINLGVFQFFYSFIVFISSFFWYKLIVFRKF